MVSILSGTGSFCLRGRSQGICSRCRQCLCKALIVQKGLSHNHKQECERHREPGSGKGKAAAAGEEVRCWPGGGRCISRVPGLAVYLAEGGGSCRHLPAGFVGLVGSAGVVHHTVVFLTVQQARTGRDPLHC